MQKSVVLPVKIWIFLVVRVCVCVLVFMSFQVRVREGQRETVVKCFIFLFSVITHGSKNHISNLFPIFFSPPSHSKTVYNQPVIDCTNEIACYNLG